MSSYTKKVGVHIAAMTDIRYYYPVISLMQLIGGYDFYLIIDDSKKYTSILRNGRNKDIFTNVFSNLLGIDSKKFIVLENHIRNNDSLKIDILFSMSAASNSKNNDFESGKYFTYNKRIIFQHGFDYLGKRKGARSACERSCYVLNDRLYEADIKERFNQKSRFLIPKLPVQYWNFEEQIAFVLSDSSPWRSANLSLEDKVAFILYPEIGNHDIVGNHVKILLDKNYKIFIKQRRKSQGIKQSISALNNVFPVFDDFWLPSEAVVFPLFSNICMGYGSAGYTDISSIRKPYIDFALTSYSKRVVNLKKFNQETGHAYKALEESGLPYPKPDHIDNFHYTENPEDFDNLLSIIESNYKEKNWYLNECKSSFNAVEFIDSITTF